MKCSREACRVARLHCGAVEAVKAAYRDQGRLPWIEIFVQDALYALRRMAKSPGFTAVVVVTLGLGIGATSALWSVVDAVLLKPLPYPEPERLVSVQLGRDGDFGAHTQNTFEYVRENASSFAHVGGTSMGSGINLAAGDEVEYVDSLRVSEGYFDVLGIAPLRGRSLTRDEESPGGPAVAVVSHRVWQRYLDGASGAPGSKIHLGGEPHTVVGVMPESFRSIPPADVWRPLPGYFDVWQIGLDLRVLAATFVIAVLTGLVFGLVPAFEATRLELREALSEGGDRQVGGRRSAWLRRALVVAEVALSLVLLIGAGLLIRTFHNLRSVELGFDPERVLTAQMSFGGSGYTEREWFLALYGRTLEHIRRLPGVESAAVGGALPVKRGLNLPVRVPDSPTVKEPTAIFYYYVTPGYFDVLGIPLVAGRDVAANDTPGSLPVAVVNQAFTRRFFAGGDVLGREIAVDFGEPMPQVRIVGVVGNVKDFGLVSEARPTMYVPVTQVPGTLFTVSHRWFDSNWLVRLAPGAVSPIAGMREAVRSVDPRLPFSGFRMMDEVVSGAIAYRRFQTVLLAVFAALALVMAAAGLYALLAYSVVQRTREIGVRMALGATRSDALRLVVREGLGLAAVGIVLGCATALALARVLDGFVYGVSTTDPVTYLGIVVAFLAVACVASAVPGMKAVRLDPVTSLREE